MWRNAAGNADTNTPAAIAWNQIGRKAGADYHGDGLAMTPTESGARLHCVFQRLDGKATSRGLWLTSTVTNTINDRFRVTAVEIGRKSVKGNINSEDPGIQHPVGGRRHGLRQRADRSLRSPRFDGRILREHGRRAAGFCGDGETVWQWFV